MCETFPQILQAARVLPGSWQFHAPAAVPVPVERWAFHQEGMQPTAWRQDRENHKVQRAEPGRDQLARC